MLYKDNLENLRFFGLCWNRYRSGFLGSLIFRRGAVERADLETPLEGRSEKKRGWGGAKKSSRHALELSGMGIQSFAMGNLVFLLATQLYIDIYIYIYNIL